MIDTQQCLIEHPHSALDLDKWQRTVDLLAEVYGSACGAIVQLRDDEFSVVSTSSNEGNFLERGSSWPWDMHSFCRRIIETQSQLYVPNALEDGEWSCAQPVEEGPVRSYYGFPIFWPDNSLFGTICIIDTKETQYPTPLLRVLQQIRELITTDLKLMQQFDQIQDLALTDELTGLNNRRGLYALATQSLKEARRQQQQIALIYLDIDGLKAVNDQHGHKVGDEAIVSLSNTLLEECREADIKARVGGDEFVLLKITSDEQYVQDFCDTLSTQYRVKTQCLPDNALGVSYGFQLFTPTHELTVEEMMSKADSIMYQQKKSKR
jgi:diguanylate cyclase (GGDEF)-like protein